MSDPSEFYGWFVLIVFVGLPMLYLVYDIFKGDK